LVVESTGNPVAAIQVAVTKLNGDLVVEAVTDATGSFAFEMSAAADLELALPTEGVAGIPIEAGKPILIIAP
jgi:uncharacterized protein YfaS (alpha-2-macroglobulin family)